MKDRILQIVSELGIKPRDFERKCGMSNGYLSSIRKGLGPTKVSNVLKAYPQINRDWLVFGEGPMFVEGNTSESSMPEPTNNYIRYWQNIDGTGGGTESFDDCKETYVPISLPDFQGCKDAINVFGNSMSPLYKSGDIIILQEWQENYIEYGNIYLIVTSGGHRMIKYLKKNEDTTKVTCVSENKEYEPFEIDKKDILRLYLVKGSISKNAI